MWNGKNVQPVFVPRTELLPENESHHILSLNICGFLASKMNNFVQNKSQATEDEKVLESKAAEDLKEENWTN